MLISTGCPRITRGLPDVTDGCDRMRAQKTQKTSLLLLKDRTRSMNRLEPGRHISIERLKLKKEKEIGLILWNLTRYAL